MPIISRKRGGNISLANNLNFTVLKINRYEVKLGVCMASLGQGITSMLDHVGAICCDRSCYFLFPQGGCRTLVVGCQKGHSLSLCGTGTLTVLNIAVDCVTLEVTSAWTKSPLSIKCAAEDFAESPHTVRPHTFSMDNH